MLPYLTVETGFIYFVSTAKYIEVVFVIYSFHNVLKYFCVHLPLVHEAELHYFLFAVIILEVCT